MSRCHIGKAGPICANGFPPMPPVSDIVTSVSHQVKFCQRGGTGRPAFGPLLMAPLAQGDAVVFIFSIASFSRSFCSLVAALIELRVPAGGEGGGSEGGGSEGGGGEGGVDGGGGEGGGGEGGGGGGEGKKDGGGGEGERDRGGEGERDGGGEGDGEGKVVDGEFAADICATTPTTRAASATIPTSALAPWVADTRVLRATIGVVAAGTVSGGGGSAGTVSSILPVIIELNVCLVQFLGAFCVPSQGWEAEPQHRGEGVGEETVCSAHRSEVRSVRGARGAVRPALGQHRGREVGWGEGDVGSHCSLLQ